MSTTLCRGYNKRRVLRNIQRIVVLQGVISRDCARIVIFTVITGAGKSHYLCKTIGKGGVIFGTIFHNYLMIISLVLFCFL